ncbi:serine/threonine-protein kinase [Nonomuraea sp. SBT364]|uniref:serine/threonine-protein kinase n=1 Tax=Nonomuraea sp. SBT364 TaxID=1580530 RepID=UPI00069CC0CE|nr:serine/threonine-protein kinase [Nonomuraea sp. SBT364]
MSGGRLANRYSLLRPLGSGGMGRVWLARDEMLDREVAVKELTLPDGLSPAERTELVTRAVREAQATAQLRHPGIVALHDVVVEHERPWLVMELLRGRTLGEAVRAHGPMPPEYVARIGADMLDALSAAHARGLQHRDVKPGNVFLTDSGRVVLTDFGIARQEGQATLTEQGLMIGSPGFISPERLEGEPGGPASDVWSLGATLFLAATGRAAYDGTTADRIRATLTQPVPVAPQPLGPLLSAMMARHPAARPVAPLLAQALRRVAAGEPAALPPQHDATVPGHVRKRGRAALWIASAATLAVAAATTTVLLVMNGQDDGVPTAFTAPMDLCSLFPREDVGLLLRTQQIPEGVPGSDEYGPECNWTKPGTGLSVQLQKDSDTRDPWSMTPVSAHTLFLNQQRHWAGFKEVQWMWKEIGVPDAQKVTLTPVRALGGLGEEAFAFELLGETGRMHSAIVYFRLANLVTVAEYTTVDDRPTDDQIKQTALQAARTAERELRGAG